MRPTRRITLACILGFIGCLEIYSSAQRKLATVTLSILDSYGKPQIACHVHEFLLQDDGVNTELAGTDYENHFTGLVGKDIPLALRYRVSVRCGQQGAGRSFEVSVERPDQLLVLSYWPHLGDYVTGAEPRLVLSVVPGKTFQGLSNSWVQISGLYVNYREVDGLDPKTYQARFYGLEPGTYLIILQTPQGLACAEKADVPGPHAKLRLQVLKVGCRVTSETSMDTEK